VRWILSVSETRSWLSRRGRAQLIGAWTLGARTWEHAGVSRSPRFPRFLAIVVALTVFGVATIASPAQRALGAATPHLVLIVMENKEYTSVVGSAAAPYINGTLMPASMVFTQYYATDHPSLPNYLALSSASTAGCLVDSCPAGFDTSENLFHQMDAAAISWKAYQGGMPSNCYPSNIGTYMVRHNPPVYYSDLSGGSCSTNDVPISQFAADLSAGVLPSFSWISPDKYDNMHTNHNVAPCKLGTALKNEVCQGDRWMNQNLPPLLALNTDADPSNDVTVAFVFDEGSTSLGAGGRVLTLVSGPNVTPGQDATTYGHLGLLNAIEDWFGLTKLHPAVPPL
jgi:phosphatidylinositol-3-phosphatase